MKRALFITWAFAAAVSLLNIGTLWPLIVTPLALVSFTKWMGFLAVPLGCAAVAALLALLIRRNAILVNVVFWLAFFAAAEVSRSLAMGTAGLAYHKLSRCIEEHRFIRSLTFAADEYQFDVHAAAVTVDDRVMLWSYSEMDYWEAPRAAYENLDFTDCRETVQALLEKTK